MMQGFQFLRLEVLTAYKSTPVETFGESLRLDVSERRAEFQAEKLVELFLMLRGI